MSLYSMLLLPLLAAVFVWPPTPDALPQGHLTNFFTNSTTRVTRSLSNGVGIWQLIGGEQYFISEARIKKSWHEAKEYCCRVLNARLISLETEPKTKKLQRHFQDYDGHSYSVWTSGSDFGHVNRFQWTATGEFFQYASWHAEAGEPDNAGGNEHCVMASFKHSQNASATKMFTKDCDNKYRFICEI